MQKHELYTESDFSESDFENNPRAKLVREGLDICKHCGAGEIELIDYPTCDEYKEYRLYEGFVTDDEQ